MSLEQRSQREERTVRLPGFDGSHDGGPLAAAASSDRVHQTGKRERTPRGRDPGGIALGARGNQQHHLARAGQLPEPLGGGKIEGDDRLGGRRVARDQAQLGLRQRDRLGDGRDAGSDRRSRSPVEAGSSSSTRSARAATRRDQETLTVRTGPLAAPSSAGAPDGQRLPRVALDQGLHPIRGGRVDDPLGLLGQILHQRR